MKFTIILKIKKYNGVTESPTPLRTALVALKGKANKKPKQNTLKYDVA